MTLTNDYQSGWELKYQEQAAGPAWNSEPQPGVSEFVAGLPPRSLVLDVGAGDGRNSSVVIAAGHQAVLLDIASTALDLALHNLRNAQSIMPLAVLGSMEEMPIAAAQFDAVICLDALPQAHHAERAMREIHRVLKPGGHAFLNLFTPADCAWGEGEQLGPRSWVYKQTLFTFWAEGELEALSERQFKVIRVEHRRWVDPPHVPFRPYEHTHDGLFYTLQSK